MVGDAFNDGGCEPGLLHFLRERARHVELSADTRLSSVLDSLGYLDFFLHLEQTYGDAVSLDAVVRCETLGELTKLLRSPSTGSSR